MNDERFIVMVLSWLAGYWEVSSEQAADLVSLIRRSLQPESMLQEARLLEVRRLLKKMPPRKDDDDSDRN